MKKLKTIQKGFTLIELLVVIAVLGVLAAGVLTAINPLKRIQQANDARGKNDLGQIAQGLQTYFTGGNPPKYPTLATAGNADSTNLAALVPNDLKTIPLPPSGYTYTYQSSDGNYFTLYTTLLAPIDPAKPVYCLDDTSGAVVQLAAAPTPANKKCQ